MGFLGPSRREPVRPARLCHKRGIPAHPWAPRFGFAFLTDMMEPPPPISMIDYNNIPRDSRRVPLETRVQFKFDRFSGFISEYSANISPGGLFLRTREPQPPGTVLDLEFRLGDGYELIRGRGEVIWVRAEDEGTARPAGMGLRFLELSEGSRELIYRIVDEHILQGGTPFDVTQNPPVPAP